MTVHTKHTDPHEKKEKAGENKDKYKTYSDDDTVNEDMKANNPTGEAENDKGHWSDTTGAEKKPRLP